MERIQQLRSTLLGVLNKAGSQKSIAQSNRLQAVNSLTTQTQTTNTNTLSMFENSIGSQKYDKVLENRKKHLIDQIREQLKLANNMK